MEAITVALAALAFAIAATLRSRRSDRLRIQRRLQMYAAPR